MKKPPFFIVGCPRSGTTLFQMLIDSHPNIAVPLESHLFHHFGTWVHYYGDLNQPENLRVCVKDVLANRWVKRWGLKVSVDEFCQRIQETSFRGVISLLFELYAESKGKVRWGDKTPEHAVCLHEIKQTFPEAKIIHLIRDGRDIAVSYKKVFSGPKTPDAIARRWVKHVVAVKDYRKQINPSDFLEVRYEDLAASPQEVMKVVFEFLGEPLPETSIMPNEKQREYFVKAGGSMHHGLAEPVSTKRVGAFKQKLTTREIEVFEAVASEALKHYGYELTSPIKPIGQGEQIVLHIQNFLKQAIRRVRHWSQTRTWAQYHYYHLLRSRYKPK